MEEGKRQKQIAGLIQEEMNEIFQPAGIEHDRWRNGFDFFGEDDSGST